MTLPRILDQTLNSGHPLNNGHFFGVPRVAVVHRFDCIFNFIEIKQSKKYSQFYINKTKIFSHRRLRLYFRLPTWSFRQRSRGSETKEILNCNLQVLKFFYKLEHSDWLIIDDDFKLHPDKRLFKLKRGSNKF